jgi:hypothetical protein
LAAWILSWVKWTGKGREQRTENREQRTENREQKQTDRAS